MEANEIAEFVEQQEKAAETHMMAVSFSISVLDAAAQKQIADFRQHTSKWDSDLAESEHRAHALEEQVEAEEHRASRYDAGEALLQIGVVLASITLLTRQRIYWLVALAIGLVGLGYGAAGFLAH